jgi:hypothetical protein
MQYPSNTMPVFKNVDNYHAYLLHVPLNGFTKTAK